MKPFMMVKASVRGRPQGADEGQVVDMYAVAEELKRTCLEFLSERKVKGDIHVTTTHVELGTLVLAVSLGTGEVEEEEE